MDLGRLWGRVRQRRRDLEAHLLPRVFPPATGRRQRAHLLDDTFDEWTVLYSPRSDASGASLELLDLAIRAIGRAREVNLTAVAQRASRDDERVGPPTWPGEHYRMLVALAEEWRRGQPVRVVEVGTFTGASALSLLSSPAVAFVTTFDVVPWRTVPFTVLREDDFGHRLEQCIGDLGDTDFFAANTPLLAEADIVFVDAAKDGVFEYLFLPSLLQVPPDRPQLLILDDVKLLPMVNLWRSVPLPKLDVASFGHWSGTGLIARLQTVDWSPPAASLGRRTQPLLRRRRPRRHP